MFCNQCEETQKGVACTVKGTCGKDKDLANRMDLLVYCVRGLGCIGHKMSESGHPADGLGPVILDSLFTTITNANFDISIIDNFIREALRLKRELIKKCDEKHITLPDMEEIKWDGEENTWDSMVERTRINRDSNEDVNSLKQTILYGLKGIAAYGIHAFNLGFEDNDIYNFVFKALFMLAEKHDSIEKLVDLTLETGRFGVKTMDLLDKANTTSFGHPEITKVNIGVGTKPGILISGHDLKDMEELLEQTKGSGVDVYTHSEMLPANYYPAFKKYEQFRGNYGSAWWKQLDEFETFNGPIVFTTNCIVPPLKTAKYKERIFVTGSTGLEGAKRVKESNKKREKGNGKVKDFGEVIEMAKKCSPPEEIESGELVGGFAHNQFDKVAEAVVKAVQQGKIKKFVVMAGCDGRMNRRKYYADFAKGLPRDTVILTAGCAKYRYNKLGLGDIEGIPRVIDAGQCNDSYSLALIALKLKQMVGANDINDLPLVFNISWYEQKAVIVLLALLSLGVKNIHLGPALPAFLSPNVLKLLVDLFGIGGVTTPEADLKQMI